jgi:hypothetical protein
VRALRSIASSNFAARRKPRRFLCHWPGSLLLFPLAEAAPDSAIAVATGRVALLGPAPSRPRRRRRLLAALKLHGKHPSHEKAEAEVRLTVCARAAAGQAEPPASPTCVRELRFGRGRTKE